MVGSQRGFRNERKYTHGGHLKLYASSSKILEAEPDHDYKISEAGDGKEALDFVAHHQGTVARFGMLDRNMPRRMGTNLFVFLKLIHFGAIYPFCLTTHGEIEEPSKAWLNYRQMIISKPFNPQSCKRDEIFAPAMAEKETLRLNSELDVS